MQRMMHTIGPKTKESVQFMKLQRMSTADDMEQGLIMTSDSAPQWSLVTELQEFGTSVRNSVSVR